MDTVLSLVELVGVHRRDPCVLDVRHVGGRQGLSVREREAAARRGRGQGEELIADLRASQTWARSDEGVPGVFEAGVGKAVRLGDGLVRQLPG